MPNTAFLKMAQVARDRSHPRLTTKTVVFYRNGDAHFPGKRFVVNPRQLTTFDSFLNAVTLGVAAPFGAVRNVFTPREGHRVLSLDTLEHGRNYVAGGSERFKRVDYINIPTKKPQRRATEMCVQPVVHSNIIVPARWRRITHEPCTINVFTNGEILVPSIRILLPKCTLLSWERVLAMVTEKVRLRTGAVHKLCRLDGSSVSSSRQLENNGYYVAVGSERFRRLPYFHWVPGNSSLQEGNMCDFLPPAPTPRKVKSYRVTFSDQMYITFQKKSAFYAKANKRTEENSRQKKEHLKSWQSSGEGSVFRAKQSHTDTLNAEEVQDDANVQVEVPVDQMEATVVEEEHCEMPTPSTCKKRSTSPVAKIREKRDNCDDTEPETRRSGCNETHPEKHPSPEAPSQEPKVPGETETETSGGRATRLLGPPEHHLPLPVIESHSLSPQSHDLSSAPTTTDPGPLELSATSR
ncbi:doublecortin domain-containing protein 2-like [Engraulis encrasicolus]|uniref:doublecortin domain-containing protein 2-like n=1 Tax=Engraulis encrasicolus TaxID=184585 RepID=UPI002FD06299